MAKLPDNFVKPPPASRLTAGKLAAPKAARRSRKVTLDLEAAATQHVDDILVRLSAEQHEALAAACAALSAVGEVVTIEDMIKQVIARWIAATRAMSGPLPAEPVEVKPEPITAQLQRLAAEP